MITNKIPESDYGVLRRNKTNSFIDEAVEEVLTIGFATLNAGYSQQELEQISKDFNLTRQEYITRYGEDRLKKTHEYHTIRSPLTFGSDIFLNIALNKNLIAMLQQLITGAFILNQQNGVINPPMETYNQGSWHPDLPYQHFISSRPLAINALFCVDDFTLENGATFVLPASHKIEALPSKAYINNNAIQVQVKAGSFIILDCMLFHSGGFNATSQERRGINQVYNIPYFKQQISIRNYKMKRSLSEEEKNILGFHSIEYDSIDHYLSGRTI